MYACIEGMHIKVTYSASDFQPLKPVILSTPTNLVHISRFTFLDTSYMSITKVYRLQKLAVHVPLYFKPKSFCLSGKTPVFSFMSSFRYLTVSDGGKCSIEYSFPLHFMVTQTSLVSLLAAMLDLTGQGQPREIGRHSYVSVSYTRHVTRGRANLTGNGNAHGKTHTYKMLKSRPEERTKMSLQNLHT